MLLAAVEGEDVGEDVVATFECRRIAGLVTEAVTDVGPRPGASACTLSVGGRHPQRRFGENLRRPICKRFVEVSDRRQRLVGDLHQ